MPQYKTYFNWSTGKDSALALHYLLQDERFSIECLLTSINAHHNRVSMHGLRTELLNKQLKAIGIINEPLLLPEQTDNQTYENLMRSKVQDLKDKGFTHSGFGDIFLEDLKQYREQQLQAFAIQCAFPLWKRNTKELMHEIIDSGFKAVVVWVNATLLDKSFAGKIIDEDFINDLPLGIDPCGENGEFHTFCFYAPYYKKEVAFTKGETILREYNNNGTKSSFWFCDLLPVN